MSRKMKILLAEDRPQDVKLTKRALRKSGTDFSLTVAPHGKEALDILKDREKSFPDIILLDWMMPIMNGEEVLEILKSDPQLRRIPVVVLTTSEDERDVRQAHDLGCNAYLVKPIDPVAFQVTINILGDFWFRQAKLPS